MKPLTYSKWLSCIALGAAALLVVGCGKKQDPVAWWQGEQERAELSQKIDIQNFRFEQLHSTGFEELEALRSHISGVDSRIAALRNQRGDLDGQIDSLKTKLQDFREDAIAEQRRKAVGKTFDTFQLSSGRSFENVSVTAIDDSGVTIRHTYGSARLRYADLDAKQRVFFGLESDLALAAQEKETKEVAAYDQWVSKQVALAAALKSDEEKSTSASASLRKMADQERRSDALAQQIAASNARPLAQPSKYVGGRYSSSYSSYRTYSPTYRYVYYGVPNCYRYNSSMIVTYPSRRNSPGYSNPTSSPSNQSFSNTTIPSIP